MDCRACDCGFVIEIRDPFLKSMTTCITMILGHEAALVHSTNQATWKSTRLKVVDGPDATRTNGDVPPNNPATNPELRIHAPVRRPPKEMSRSRLQGSVQGPASPFSSQLIRMRCALLWRWADGSQRIPVWKSRATPRLATGDGNCALCHILMSFCWRSRWPTGPDWISKTVAGRAARNQGDHHDGINRGLAV